MEHANHIFFSFFSNINLFILIGGQLPYNILLVLPYINMNPPQVYMCPHPEPPSLFPPHPISQGHPSAPAQSTLPHASNLGLVIYFTDDNSSVQFSRTVMSN